MAYKHSFFAARVGGAEKESLSMIRRWMRQSALRAVHIAKREAQREALATAGRGCVELRTS
jgi:hypothetical protein